ncbi:MAG: hypothetical protein RBU21_11365 [FCB group bacterium]|jgi:uncharacterized membrane protein|nr:hypothetical protein [FCB group bacterium]
MKNDPEERREPRPSDGLARYVLKRLYARRTVSLYLLLALFVALPLGTQMIGAKEDPRRFALFITLHLVFLFVVLVRAVYDIAEIARDHMKERERVYRSTLGEREFARELGERVSRHRDDV